VKKTIYQPALLEGLELRRMLAAAATGLAGAGAMRAQGVVASAVTAPSSVTANALGQSHGITINWADVAGETGYSIERSADGNAWTPVGTTAADITTFRDSNLPENSTFQYHIITNTSTGPTAPSASATATTAKYRILQSPAFANMPEPMAPGIETLYLVPQGALYSKKGALVAKKVKAVALEAQTRNQILVLDVEKWSVDTRFSTTAEIDASLAEMSQIIAMIRKTAPGVKLGFWNIGVTGVPQNLNDATAMAKWKQSVDYLVAHLPEQDFQFPGLYTKSSVDINANEWEASSKAILEQAARYAKPIYPFLYMNDLDTGDALPGDYWKMQMSTMRQFADGAVIWGGSGSWDPNAPWFQATLGVQAETAAPAGPPVNLAVDGNGAKLSWNALPNTIDGVIIEKSSDGLNFSRAGIAFGDQTSWNDPLLSSTSTTYYRLRTFNGFGQSQAGPAKSAVINRDASLWNEMESREGEMGDWRDRHTVSAANGGWQQFRAVNFGSGAGMNQLLLKMYVPPEDAGQQITVRLDSLSGPIAGSTTISSTAYEFNLYSIAINNVTGTHDVFLTYSGGQGRTTLDAWQFNINKPPAKPIVLKSGSFGDHVNLSWTDLSGDETEYRVQRSSDRVHYQTVATLPPNTTSFSDTSFPATGRYDYRIVAANLSGESQPTKSAGGRYGGLNPFQKIEAEASDDFGVEVGGGPWVRTNVVAMFGKTWMRLFGADFGSVGSGTFDINIALPRDAAGNYLDLRLDTVDGPVIGTLQTVGTGPNREHHGHPSGWGIFKVQSTTFAGATGIHDLYLVSRSPTSLGDVDWFQFKPAAAPATVTAASAVMAPARVDPLQIAQDDDEDDLDLE
jgi:hypothetical protein